MSVKEHIALTVSTHPRWGIVLMPVLVEEHTPSEWVVLETAQKSFIGFPNLNEAAREILCITERYADKSLIKSYSKAKTIREFHSSVTDNTIEKYIRPFIEGCHQKIIRLLLDSKLPLYERHSIKERVLRPSSLIKLPTHASTVVFTFEKDESGFRYFLRMDNQGTLIGLFGKKCTVLCKEPAMIVADKSLHYFETIDVKKLLPFFAKKSIEVPLTSENTYMKTFVRKCVQDFQVSTTGLDIQEIQPKKAATLSLENDWNGRSVLIVNILYEGKKYPLDVPNKKIVLMQETTEAIGLRWFFPDKQWEQQLINSLTNNGLKQTGLNAFSLSRSTDQSEETETHTLVDWLRAHKDIVSEFLFSQNLNHRVVYLGEITLRTTIEAKQDWFDLHCTVVFDHFQIPFNQFRQHILENIREYVLPDGTILILPNEWFTKYYDLMFFSIDRREKMVLQKNQYRIAANAQQEGLIDNAIPLQIDNNKSHPSPPSSFKAKLRNYQLYGFQWLVSLYRQGFGGCLADDMGLGKTVQVLALLAYLYDNKQNVQQLSLFDAENLPSLIVMPTSLLYNWQLELKKCAPNLRVYTYSGSKRLKNIQLESTFKQYHVVLTTYGVLRNDIEWLENCPFQHLILDESQYVKNPDSQIYRAVAKIQKLHSIALTGTPVENSLTDLWAEFNLLNKNMLGSYASFRNAYQNPIAKDDKEKIAALLRIIQPFLLRRTKLEAAPDLPPLLEETVYCDMTPAQKHRYTEEKNALRKRLLEDKTVENTKLLPLLTLQGLTRLRLLANHPVLTHPEYTEDSGKFEQIVMRLETLRAEGHKVLIFSSFVRHLNLLANYLESEKQPYAWLTGSTPASEREKEINRFSNQADIHCFLISLKAGGVGLNLTAADYVFLLDPWWNPASEMQALSRSHRIGQTKKVIVYRFISSKTIEEKIRRLQEGKSKLANAFVRSGNPLAGMGYDDLDRLME